MICLPEKFVNFIILSAFLHKNLFGSGKCIATFLNSGMVRRACCLPTKINFRFLLLELFRGLIGCFFMALFVCVAI